MNMVSKFKRSIDLHLGIKFVNMGSLDKFQHDLEVEINQNPLGSNVKSALHFVKLTKFQYTNV